MELPRWLDNTGQGASRQPLPREVRRGKNEARFLGKTLRHVLSFVADTLFNERVSAQRGLLQGIEGRLKILTFFFLIVVLSLQKTVPGILVFLVPVVLTMTASRIPPLFFLKRLLPTAVFTLLISVPVILNLVVPGEPLLVLLTFQGPLQAGPLVIPGEIAVTRQGLESAATLFLRVLTSVSFVFLLTMTTQPNRFMQCLSSLIPGPLGSVVAISYRYIFFLVRKVEQYVMGLRARQISPIRQSGGRRWAASRIALLFSVSMELSNDLAMAMESRGCREEIKSPHPRFRLSGRDLGWLFFTAIFGGVMIWKSLT
ncbi:MAG: energy-coupling factor transporter transmembrane protein EcfT [Nitrospirae bacterium]|nr:energy-coupling factor transporter transmembrane protein EcfT [Nitrospirota bacterium]